MSEEIKYSFFDKNIFIGKLNIDSDKTLFKQHLIERVIKIGGKPLKRSERVPNVYYKSIKCDQESIRATISLNVMVIYQRLKILVSNAFDFELLIE